MLSQRPVLEITSVLFFLLTLFLLKSPHFEMGIKSTLTGSTLTGFTEYFLLSRSTWMEEHPSYNYNHEAE